MEMKNYKPLCMQQMTSFYVELKEIRIYAQDSMQFSLKNIAIWSAKWNSKKVKIMQLYGIYAPKYH